jgi:hypothetical protein
MQKNTTSHRTFGTFQVEFYWLFKFQNDIELFNFYWTLLEKSFLVNFLNVI